jgi:hypothetical protein
LQRLNKPYYCQEDCRPFSPHHSCGKTVRMQPPLFWKKKGRKKEKSMSPELIKGLQTDFVAGLLIKGLQTTHNFRQFEGPVLNSTGSRNQSTRRHTSAYVDMDTYRLIYTLYMFIRIYMYIYSCLSLHDAYGLHAKIYRCFWTTRCPRDTRSSHILESVYVSESWSFASGLAYFLVWVSYTLVSHTFWYFKFNLTFQ